jgi:IS30 family transposase
LQDIFVKIQQQSQKKSGCTGSATGITKAVLTMHITFASTDIIAKKSMPVARSFLCGVKCTTCPTCNQTCPDFVKERCNRLDKAPYVCNGCPKAINHCTIAHKYRYDAIFADRKYKECLSQSRAGINMTRHELHQKDMVITPLIFQGQSPYQIVTNHPELDMSVRTLYSYLDKGILSARNIDLKRQVKFTPPRKVHKTQIKDRSVFIRRMFSDFQALELDHFAEMDTVHSSQDSKRVILTFFLTREKLFLAFIMNRCTKGAVKLVFNKLEHQLGTYDFLTLCLTMITVKQTISRLLLI